MATSTTWKKSTIIGKSCTPPPYPPMHPLTIPDTTWALSPTPKKSRHTFSPPTSPSQLKLCASHQIAHPSNISLSINLRSDRLSPPRSAIPSLPPYFPTFHPSPPVSRNALPSYSYPRPSFRTFSLTCDTHHISDNPAPSPRNPHHPHDHVSTHAQLRAITRRNQVANST